ncbi:MAG: PIN domain-containing protein [Chloroflexi bacterium]|nr:PIN domain-containing protein [Chloroflexota bacterium]
MNTYLLDTNIVSGIIRKELAPAQRLRAAIVAEDTVYLSAVVYYECKRGLLKRDANKQMDALEHVSEELAWGDVLRKDWEDAAQSWANRFNAGAPIEDADLLIAVQAKRLNAILVTDNEKDFDGLGISIENWRKAAE